MRDTNQDLDYSLRDLSSTSHPRREFVTDLRANLKQRAGGTSLRRFRLPWLDLHWLRASLAQAGLVMVLVGLVALSAWLSLHTAPLAQHAGKHTPLFEQPKPSSRPAGTFSPLAVRPLPSSLPNATSPRLGQDLSTTPTTDSVAPIASATTAPKEVVGTVTSSPTVSELLLLCANASELLRSSATPTPLPSFYSLSSQDQARSRRILARYNQLCADIKNLQTQYAQTSQDRLAFQSFWDSQQILNRNTDNLQSSLNIYDSFIKQGNAALQDAIDTLDDRSGFDSSGNVVLLDTVESNINSALDGYLTARNFLASGVNELHSSLNQFRQVWGIGVPHIPEMHLAPYMLPTP